MSTNVFSLLWRTGAVLIIFPQKIDSNWYLNKKIKLSTKWLFKNMEKNSHRQGKFNAKKLYT